MTQLNIPNVVVFGETGVGKSSVVNMILGENLAETSDGAVGCTFQHAKYPVEIEGKSYNLYDTAGLNEGGAGTVDGAQAIANLYSLVHSLSKSGGVSLLVFVVRRGRITESTHKNYRLFHDTFCESMVPIVLAITGCEDVEPDMDSWWARNEESYENYDMSFEGYACVCASRGRNNRNGTYSNDQPFRESKVKVELIIRDNCSARGWKKEPIAWFQRILYFLKDSFKWWSKIPAQYTAVYQSLCRFYTTDQASKIIDAIEKYI